jgi:hypothetical protein
MENTNETCRCGACPHGMGMLLPLLVLLLMIGMLKHAAKHKHGMMGAHPSSWENGVPPMFAELHRRAHAAEKAEGSKESAAE